MHNVAHDHKNMHDPHPHNSSNNNNTETNLQKAAPLQRVLCDLCALLHSSVAV